MEFFLKVLIIIGGIGVGTALIKYSYPITQMIGHNELAEKYLGDGGTYTMWKLLGLLVIIGSVWYFFR